MARSVSIPKGATGVYRLDCSSSPRRFDDATALTVVKKGPPGPQIFQTVGSTLNLHRVRIRQWVKKHPSVLKRIGKGVGTRFFVPSEN